MLKMSKHWSNDLLDALVIDSNQTQLDEVKKVFKNKIPSEIYARISTFIDLKRFLNQYDLPTSNDLSPEITNDTKLYQDLHYEECHTKLSQLHLDNNL